MLATRLSQSWRHRHDHIITIVRVRTFPYAASRFKRLRFLKRSSRVKTIATRGAIFSQKFTRNCLAAMKGPTSMGRGGGGKEREGGKGREGCGKVGNGRGGEGKGERRRGEGSICVPILFFQQTKMNIVYLITWSTSLCSSLLEIIRNISAMMLVMYLT